MKKFFFDILVVYADGTWTQGTTSADTLIEALSNFIHDDEADGHEPIEWRLIEKRRRTT